MRTNGNNINTFQGSCTFQFPAHQNVNYFMLKNDHNDILLVLQDIKDTK